MEEVRRLWGGERRGKVIAAISGNHEGRTHREADFDIVRYWANEEPRIPYLDRAGAVSLRAGGQTWIIYGMHGVRGGGRKPGGSVNAVSDMAEVVDADLYIHGHHHRASFHKSLQMQHRTGNLGFYWRSRWFVNGGTLHQYGGYGSDAAFPATDVGAYLVWLKGRGPNKGKDIRVEFLDRAYFSLAR